MAPESPHPTVAGSRTPVVESCRLALCVSVAAALLSGCYTFESLADPDGPKIYGGVRMHFRVQHDAEAGREQLGAQIVRFVFDFPLCALGDTVLLPATVFLEPAAPEVRARETGERRREK